MSFTILRNSACRRATTNFTRRYATGPESASAKAKSNWGLYLAAAGLAGIGGYTFLQRNDQATAVQKPKQERSPFDPNNFVEFKLKKVEPYNHNTSKFIFELPDNQASLLPIASCVVVRSPDPEALKDKSGKPVIRPYTPISPSDAPGELTFLIKKYPYGLASVYIHNLKPGETLAIKGPIPKFDYKINEFDEVGLIGGGSGITPLYQLLTYGLSKPENKTKFTLLFSNVSEKDILLREEFDELAKKFPDKFKVVYYVDKGEKDWKGETGYISKEGVKKHVPGPEKGNKVKIFVCGPPGQVASLAGNKDGMKQGELSGILKELGYTGEQRLISTRDSPTHFVLPFDSSLAAALSLARPPQQCPLTAHDGPNIKTCLDNSAKMVHSVEEDDFTLEPRKARSSFVQSQMSNTASAVSTAVDPTSFYGTSSSVYNRQASFTSQEVRNVQGNINAQSPPRALPALPKRQNSAMGSSHTKYLPPQTSFGGTYQEPTIDPINLYPSEPVPDLVQSSQFDPNAGSNVWPTTFNDVTGRSSGWGNEYNTRLSPAHTWGAEGDVRLIEDAFAAEPPIDGRDLTMERRWWDLQVPGASGRPGPGMLPPRLVDNLHHPDHSLVTVTVTPPETLTGSAPARGSGSGCGVGSAAPSSPKATVGGSGSGSHSRSSSTSISPAPSAEELREAVPHPHAYYCRRHNGWVLLIWRSSSILPPLAPSFSNNPHAPLPDQNRRKTTTNCLEETPIGRQQNKTHHFHRYEKAVDAAYMTPKYTPRSWERLERSKRSHRRMTIGSDDLDPMIVEQAVEGDEQSEQITQKVIDAREELETHNLLDLYVCCQCSFYVVVSDVIPGVIPIKTLDAFITEKQNNPPVGKSCQYSVHTAMETVMMVIENKLWRGNNKMLSVTGKTFSSKVGWNPTVQKLFESMGFKLYMSSPKEGVEATTTLQPPDTDPSSEHGCLNRERLLRVWVELGATLVDFRRRFPIVLKDHAPHRLWVTTENAREMYQSALGAHADQIKRGQLPDSLQEAVNLDPDWEKLGITPSTYDAELLHFAYLAQCRCDPQDTPGYFQALSNIVDSLRAVLQCPSSLETLLVAEKSRGRFTFADVQTAIRTLGFGTDNDLRVDYDEDVDDHFLLSAWRDALRRSWRDPDGASKRRDLNEAFRILAENRRSADLIKAFEEEQLHGMTPEKAYDTLEVPMGVDEEMLITVYNMRVEDQPSSFDKMREAMRVIAEFTFSERLQRFLETGIDPGVVSTQTRPEWPRGLNQLGNTCYLNSLLQYFYTIKDLRDSISPLAVEEKFMDSDKLKDDDLKHHRVGGRMVSRCSSLRSFAVVSQLANLFLQLENCESPAVTPTLELAKLALVTSKDEEEDDPDRVGTDSSHSTDATLVDEPAPIRDSASPQPKSPSPASSILGKRPRSFSRKKSAEGVSIGDQDREMNESGPSAKASGSNTPVTATADPDGDIRMETQTDSQVVQPASQAPPLPPRPKATAQYSGTGMMFGKQHDVAECMDNCMFQIETALLRFGELIGPDDNSKRSIVKRLFYGKIRQRLSVPPDPKRSKSSIHEREDYFSHLPVNVSEESFDLYDGLSGYFAMEDDVDFEGSRAKMNVSLVELPPILQIQLQRVQFNRDALQPYKSHAYVKFGETICMDRFLDDAPAEKKAKTKQIQAELNSCRERIHHLTRGKYAPFEQNLGDSCDFLSKQTALELPEATNELKMILQSEKERVTNEITALRARLGELKAQLEDLWTGENRAEYELTSVFVHRGSSPTFGHYFIYQRWLPDRPDEWFKYNDSDVSVVDKSEVLADTTGSTANPYLLVFARKGSQVIQTVNRSNAMDIE
ncbi:cysteine proteinase [Sanghuangporus baumii]|uniref:cytochrome-b5 reductase n=1 Tax=Sanghuangporus baumii TaxID=108892 RepID=A0A9Q5N1B6_SANBA|nr:cysteine proteinase [Sanghuangporus baumii]